MFKPGASGQAGGRNESFFIGPSPVGVWRDYDLAGAYSTGLVDMPLIDFENPKASLGIEDYLGHVAGYALIDFAHPDDTRFPGLAVSRGGKGLIFPLHGTAYATAAEIRVALYLYTRYSYRKRPHYIPLDELGLLTLEQARVLHPRYRLQASQGEDLKATKVASFDWSGIAKLYPTQYCSPTSGLQPHFG